MRPGGHSAEDGKTAGGEDAKVGQIQRRWTRKGFCRLSRTEILRVTGIEIGYVPGRVRDRDGDWVENDPGQVGWCAWTWAGEMVADPARTMRGAKEAIYDVIDGEDTITDETGPTRDARRNQVLDTVFQGNVPERWGERVAFFGAGT